MHNGGLQFTGEIFFFLRRIARSSQLAPPLFKALDEHGDGLQRPFGTGDFGCLDALGQGDLVFPGEQLCIP